MPYKTPGDDIVAILDTPLTPLPVLTPDGKWLLLVTYEPHPPISLLARPYLRLGGVRVDPSLGGRQRTMRLVGITILSTSDGSTREVALAPGASISVPSPSPDSTRFVFTVDADDGIAVWVGDIGSGEARPIADLLVSDLLPGGQLGGGGPVRWTRDGRSLLALALPDRRPPLPSGSAETDIDSPRIQETAAKRTQTATFQDLLSTEADNDRFEHFATTQLVRVDPSDGKAIPIGAPAMISSVTESPDGQHLLVRVLQRPFSFRVPSGYFSRRVEVWSAGGRLETTIADLPVSDEVPRQGVPTGPRNVDWEERAPASLLWTEALDGGDPVAPAEHRDRLMRLVAPFVGEPAEVVKTQHRCLGWHDLDQTGRLLLLERDRDRRWLTTWLLDVSDPESRRVAFDRSEDDDYGDPGNPLYTTKPDGARTVLQVGDTIYLRGRGASPAGDRPFLDAYDVVSSERSRLHESPAEVSELAMAFLDTDNGEVLVRHESSGSPPNFSVLRLGDGARRALTSFADPHPQLSGVTRRWVTLDRGDGVALSGLLHLPPGHDPARDGRLPLVVWAYPMDYGDADTAGQLRGSDKTFVRFAGDSPIWFLLRGWAVLLNATMPVVGDQETKNDTYIEQITTAARAHIAKLDAEGVIDADRVVVGGHSYGGFMTANLLAHTDLFAAGIARSGAYNRSLTPWGFQTERRSFWEASEVYDRVSPFRHADTIKSPLLLVHGASDNNTGTFTIQSERLFQAMQGTGGTARLVLLPHEAHGYRARESVLHVIAEQFEWVDRWAPPKPAD